MRQALLATLLAFILLLAACHNPQAPIAAPSDEPAEEETPPTIDAFELPPEPETHACALLTKEDGEKFCGMDFEASDYIDVQYHDTVAVCRQYFMRTEQPYPKVMVDRTMYYTPDNATKMFGRDRLTKHGEAWQYNDSFISYDDGVEIEFISGDSRVELRDPQGACFKLDDLAALAHERLAAK